MSTHVRSSILFYFPDIISNLPSFMLYRAIASLLQFIDEGHWRKILINNKTQRPGSEMLEIIGLKSLYAF